MKGQFQGNSVTWLPRESAKSQPIGLRVEILKEMADPDVVEALEDEIESHQLNQSKNLGMEVEEIIADQNNYGSKKKKGLK